MMLPVDITLVAEPAFRKWVEIYAKDEDKFFKVCCRSCIFRFRLILYYPKVLYLSFSTILYINKQQDFAAAFSKLLALGVPAAAAVKPWYQIW
jgi:hypothetical protein